MGGAGRPKERSDDGSSVAQRSGLPWRSHAAIAAGRASRRPSAARSRLADQ